jgi:hypothetical protein
MKRFKLQPDEERINQESCEGGSYQNGAHIGGLYSTYTGKIK